MRPAPPKDGTNGINGKVEAEEEEDDLYATAPKRILASEATAHLSLVVQPSLELGAMPQMDGSGLAWQWLPVVDETGTLQVSLSLVGLEELENDY